MSRKEKLATAPDDLAFRVKKKHPADRYGILEAVSVEKVYRSPPIKISISQPEEKKRPAFYRDHLWLKWEQTESLTPAKIRDKWNTLTDEQRQSLSPTKWAKIYKTTGYEVVKKGIRTAKREKLTGEN